MTTVLLHPLHATSCNKMISIANALHKENCEVIWLVENSTVRTRLNHLSDFQKWDVIEYEKKVFLLSVKNNIKLFLERALIFLKKQTKFNGYYWFRCILMINDLRHKERTIRQIFNKNKKVDIVLVSGDRHLGYEPAVLKIANELHIPCLVPAISVGLNPKDRARRRYVKNSDYDLSSEYGLHRKFPDQFILNEERKIGFYYGWQIRALDYLEMLPEKPWTLGASKADYLLVRGEAEKDENIKYGLPLSKILVTGDPDYDVLYNTMLNKKECKKSIYDFYQFSSGKNLIVASLPQTFEHKVLSWDDHWKMIEHICKNLAQQDSNVLLSLHPKMDIKNYQYLEKDFSITIARHSLSEILVAADVFVAGQGSSTLLWAMLCNIPTVVCDWFGLNYKQDYWQAKMDIVTDAKVFGEALSNNMEVTYRQSKVKELEQFDKKILYDGQAMNRLVEAMKTYSKHSNM